MSRNKKIIRNTLILILIIFILFPRYNLYLTPLSAYRASEKSIHYGPSQVVHTEDYEGGKYILAKYDKWTSYGTVKKNFLFFWTIGDQYVGIENDQSKDISYTWGAADEIQYTIWGTINNKDIKNIKIILQDGTTFTQTEFYEDMFLIKWRGEYNNTTSANASFSIKGYGKDNNLIFEEEYPY